LYSGRTAGDWDSTITEQLARSHSDCVVAIHLTDVPFGHIFQKPDDLSPAELANWPRGSLKNSATGAIAMAILNRGGQFAAMEEPELLTEDIRTWFRPFRDGN
jgi:hypothetical protein